MWNHYPNHTHKCRFKKNGCDNRVQCSDRFLEWNHSGYPEIICRANQDEVLACEDCDLDRLCDSCYLPERLGHLVDCEYWNRTILLTDSDEQCIYTNAEFDEDWDEVLIEKYEQFQTTQDSIEHTNTVSSDMPDPQGSLFDPRRI